MPHRCLEMAKLSFTEVFVVERRKEQEVGRRPRTSEYIRKEVSGEDTGCKFVCHGQL